jgi:acyl-CoA synthetase (AMP-forming)/AMP-acid ligase II
MTRVLDFPLGGTLIDVLCFRAEEYPERTLFVFLGDGENQTDRLTYGQLHREAGALAALLRGEAGVGRGERALLLYPPGLDFVRGFFACLYAGIVAVPVYAPHPRRPDLRVQMIARDCQPSVVLADSHTLVRCAGVLDQIRPLTGVRRIASDQCIAGGKVFERGEDQLPVSEDLALIQYTSGSTSDPRGVCVTHANIMANEGMIQEAMGFHETDCFVSWLPTHHDMGLIGDTLQAVYSGCRAVKMPASAFLQHPRRWLRAVTRYRGTVIGGPNFAYDLCVARIPEAERGELDLSSLRVTYCGSEPIQPETLARFAEGFSRCGLDPRSLFPCYGLAEATLMVSGGPNKAGMRTLSVRQSAFDRGFIELAGEGESGARVLISSGRLVRGCRVEIMNPHLGQRVSPGEVGEVWVQGAHTATAYWEKPQESAAMLRAVMDDGQQGFLRTGDLGFLHEGELFITGRIKDMIIVNGRNVYPHDIEHIARESCPGLATGAGAAFGVAPNGKETVVLVHEAPRLAGGEEMNSWRKTVRTAVAEAAEVQLHELVFVPWGSVARTSSGKVRRSVVREQYLHGVLEDVQRVSGWAGNAREKAND